MTQHDHKQFAGVWVDHQKALIITKEAGAYAIKDKIMPPPGFESDNELHVNNAKHADLLAYFKSLSGCLQPYGQLLIFGPGKAQGQFHNYLKEDAKFDGKQITVENTDHLTDHQIIAKVREFFT